MKDYVNKHFTKSKFKGVNFEDFEKRYKGKLPYDIRAVYEYLTGKKAEKKPAKK